MNLWMCFFLCHRPVVPYYIAGKFILYCRRFISTCPTSAMERFLYLKDGNSVETTMAKCTLLITTTRKLLGWILVTGTALSSPRFVPVKSGCPAFIITFHNILNLWTEMNLILNLYFNFQLHKTSHLCRLCWQWTTNWLGRSLRPTSGSILHQPFNS